MKRYCQEGQEVVNSLSSNAQSGLTCAEAEKRLEENGKNKLAEGKKKSVIRRFFEQLADPMIIILIVAAAISGALTVYESIESGVKEFPTDVIIILAVVLINAVLGVFQESKAEKAIEALQQMSAATSKVLRDGKVIHTPSENLVVGDIILLEAGDSVPADARLLECASLKVEEAALTGESVPVEKMTDAIVLGEGAKDVPLGDRKNM
ncbi:MAG: HAD-IC family P-type ATPase, partial [Clostridia bacterium]|nr:HAD-IC family P-type ATPase [Clostridia bacterium]